MSSFDPEQLTEAANQQLIVSAQRDPRVYTWGLFAWGDAPAACGGGVGCFQWFATADEALAFLSDYSPAMYCTFDDEEEWLLLRQRLRQITAQWPGNPAEAQAAMNAELSGLLQVDWMCSYDELCEGKSAFSRKILRAFAEEEGADEDWIPFLQNYGI